MFFRNHHFHHPNSYRKIISLLLLVTMLATFGLAGCGFDSAQQGASAPAQQTTQQSAQNNDAAAQPQQTASQQQTVSQQQNTQSVQKSEATPQKATVTKNGEYTSMQDVADYLHEYGKLPSNFITKNKAKDLGWDSEKGNLGKVAPGKSIGGDTFGNREGLLPKKDGRKYYECDINYDGGYRGAERIIYSNDGLIYYTNDHYKTFTQLY